MTAYRYMYSAYEPKTQARAVGLMLPISQKKSIEICNAVRGKPLGKAKALLERVIAGAQPLALTRFNRGGTGHKPGTAGARFPVKTCSCVLDLLRSVEANAEQKGLDAKSLVVVHAATQKGAKVMRYGRQGRRMAKRATVEVVVAEQRASATEQPRAAAKAKEKTRETKQTKENA